MAKCDECGREFAAEAGLAQHLKDKHGLGPGASAKAVAGGPKERRKPKSLRRRNRHPVAIGIAAVAVALVLGLYLTAAPSAAQPPFPCSTEGAYDHIHPYLQIWVGGSNVTIPAGVGLLQEGTCTEPVHMHDASGILHLELSRSQAGQSWTLADFFSIWKYSCSQNPSLCPTVNGAPRPVVFNQTDIFGFRADSTHSVTLLVDGTPSSQWGALDLLQLDYCSAALASAFPCSQTAGGNPAWECVAAGQCGTYPYGTGHKIVIEYAQA